MIVVGGLRSDEVGIICDFPASVVRLSNEQCSTASAINQSIFFLLSFQKPSNDLIIFETKIHLNRQNEG